MKQVFIYMGAAVLLIWGLVAIGGNAPREHAKVVRVADQSHPPLGAANLSAMHQAYTDNELKFARTYVGRGFVARLPFRAATNSLWGKNQLVHFGGSDGLLGRDVLCEISDDPTIELVAVLSKDAILNVSGTVKDSLMGEIVLDECELSSNGETK